MSAGQVELSGEELEEFERLFPEIARYRAGRRRDDREPRPFAFEDLERAMGGAPTHSATAVLRLSMSTLRRLRTTGLTAWQADRYACRAGLHPGEVWDEWWDLAD